MNSLRVAGINAQREWEWQAKVWRVADSLMTFNQYLFMVLFAIALGVWIAGGSG